MIERGPFHAFIDESIRGRTYRLTSVRVRSKDLAVVTRDVRQRIPKGQRRPHMSDEGKQRRRQILRGFASLEIRATVYETPYAGRGDDKASRDRCLQGLVADEPTLDVVSAVLDTRGELRDRQDRFTLHEAMRTACVERFGFIHRASGDDCLLALPDAIGWAFGRGGEWRRLIEPVTTLREIDELG